ncbi:MAG: ABC transporter ATPase [Chitinophagales bacterium]|nr:ABC transporter ATPase [Chitinophagales bacterium]
MTTYTELHPDSKVWIYQADRVLNPYEQLSIKQKIDLFTKEWASHGKDVKAFGDIYYDRFIVLFADETRAGVSGCSIDSSVQFIQSIGREYDINFFNRLQVAFKDGDEIRSVPQSEFTELCSNGVIHNSTIVFNNLISSKREFESRWEGPISESWHSRFIS